MSQYRIPGELLIGRGRFDNLADYTVISTCLGLEKTTHDFCLVWAHCHGTGVIDTKFQAALDIYCVTDDDSGGNVPYCIIEDVATIEIIDGKVKTSGIFPTMDSELPYNGDLNFFKLYIAKVISKLLDIPHRP